MYHLKNKTVLIVGDGVSGKGAYQAAELLGAKAIVYDDKSGGVLPEQKPDLIVVSPGIALVHRIYKYAKYEGVEIIGELEFGYLIHANHSNAKVIAVTGTNGKTTTVRLIGDMLSKRFKVNVCGNVGVSFALTAAKGGYDAAVVETSSFQLESVHDFKPDIAIITNITPDHLDRHKTLSDYAACKMRIAAKQSGADKLIISQDDIPLSALDRLNTQAEIMYTSLRGRIKGCYLQENKIYFLDEFICDRDRIRLSGDHNIANVLNAVCAAKLMGAANSEIIQTLTSFVADEHRCKEITSKFGKTYYDDSKGTNIGATLKAASSMPSSTCIILGGSDKGYEYDELFENLSDQVVYAVTIGETAEKIEKAAYRCGFYDIERAGSLKEAIEIASTTDAENVLLSPASASFDMFKDYKARGEEFIRLVGELKK